MNFITYYVPMVYPNNPEYAQVFKLTMSADVHYRCVRKLLRRWARINHGISVTADQARRIVSQGRKLAQVSEQRTPAS